MPDWMNGEVTAEEPAGKPLLGRFWSITCHICHDAAEEVAKWQAEYGPRELVVINEHTTVGRFENQFVPAYYVFDRDHALVHRQAGDRGFERLHDKIGALLGEPVASAWPGGRARLLHRPRRCPTLSWLSPEALTGAGAYPVREWRNW